MRVVVVGAGNIGCWVGGMLVGPVDVTLVGRPAVIDPIRRDGLTLEAPGRPPRRLPAQRLHLATDAAQVAGAEIVLLCVKSRDTVATTRSLVPSLAPGTLLVSLQNGLHNAERIRATLDEAACPATVLAGMVAFNVVRTGPTTYRRATSGDILVDDDPAAAGLLAAAARAGLPLRPRRDMREVQHAKLLLNLNNAVNALSGLPLRDELADRDLRRVLARCQEEALAAYAAAGVAPARLSPLGPAHLPAVLRTPTPIFRLLARASLQVDPAARSSMADDLAAGRPTEIDELQGEVVRLGERHGIPTPVCAALCRLVAEAERASPAALPRWSGPALLEAVGSPGG